MARFVIDGARVAPLRPGCPPAVVAIDFGTDDSHVTHYRTVTEARELARAILAACAKHDAQASTTAPTAMAAG